MQIYLNIIHTYAILTQRGFKFMTTKFFTVPANSSVNINIVSDFNVSTGAARIAVSAGLAGFTPAPALTLTRKKTTRKKKGETTK